MDSLDELNIPALKADNVKIRNREELAKTILAIKAGGTKKLQIISDFDRTISKYHKDGVTSKSSYSIFELIPSLPKEFVKTTVGLYERFRGIEDDPGLTIAEKIPYMEEWWKLTENCFLGLSFDEEEIRKAVKESNVHLRDGIQDSFEKLKDLDVPVLVFSAGLGNVVSVMLTEHNMKHKNVHVISNFFDVENNKIIGFKGKTLHVYNKNEHAIENSEYFNVLAHKGNIILMGDSLGDANMEEGVPELENIIKIGFLNLHVDRYLPQYLDHFDIVLVDDQTMDVFNGILNFILST